MLQSNNFFQRIFSKMNDSVLENFAKDFIKKNNAGDIKSNVLSTMFLLLEIQKRCIPKKEELVSSLSDLLMSKLCNHPESELILKPLNEKLCFSLTDHFKSMNIEWEN